MTSNSEKIEELIQNYEKQVKEIKSECFRFCWYMRGGITYDQSMNLSYEDRGIISNIIKENLETTKKTNLPFF